MILISGPLLITNGTVSTVTTLVSSPSAFSVDSDICRNVSYAAIILRSYALQMLDGENTRLIRTNRKSPAIPPRPR